MYNGIGLQTARGSGTNGHVQRNLSFVRLGKKDNEKYKTEDLNHAEAINNRQPNEGILEHERKRKMEVKILEFEEILEDQDYTADEIAAKVQAFREKLMNERKEDGELPKDEFGRYSVRETHQIAAAKHEKNAMLRSAFGISEYFVEGSSFDADRKAKEELTKSAGLQKELDAQRSTKDEKSKRYRLIRTPSPESNNKAEKTSKDHMKPDRHRKKDSLNKEKAEQKSKDKEHSKNDDRSRKHRKRKSKRDCSSNSSDSSSSPNEEITKKSKRKRKHSDSSETSSTSSSSSSPDSSDSERETSKRSGKRNHSRSKSDNNRKNWK